MEFYKWCIYCTTDEKFEFIWSIDPPTTCPFNSEHTVNADSVRKQATMYGVKQITFQNSPFTVKHNQFHVCDCSNGSIQVLLPPLGQRVNQRTLSFVKTGTAESETCTITPFGSNTIGTQSSIVLESDNSFLQITSDSLSDWTVVNIEESGGLIQTSKSAPKDDLWIFRESFTKAVGAGTNVTNEWTNRNLNNTFLDGGHEIILNTTTNVLTITNGTYEVKASSTFFGAGFTKLRLYCVTDEEEVLSGLNSFSQSNTVQHVSSMEGFFTVDDDPKEYVIQYFSTKEQKLTGLGRASGFNTTEVYTQVHFRKVVDR